MIMLDTRKDKVAITDLNQVQQMLRHLGMLAEHINQAAAITDLNGYVHFANARWASIHGYESSAELLGKNLRVFYTPDYMKSQVKGFMQQTKNAGYCVTPAEHIKKDGGEFPTKLKMTALTNGRGRAEAFLILAEDLTWDRKLEKELADAKKQVASLEAQLKSKQKPASAPKREYNEEPAMAMSALPADEMAQLAKMAQRFKRPN